MSLISSNPCKAGLAQAFPEGCLAKPLEGFDGTSRALYIVGRGCVVEKVKVLGREGVVVMKVSL